MPHQHLYTPREAIYEMRHRSIDDADLNATAFLLRSQTQTDDMRVLAARCGLRVMERSIRASVDGMALPGGIILLQKSQSEEEKIVTIGHELGHFCLMRRPHTHGDVWFLGLAFVRELALFRANDDLTWVMLMNSLREGGERW